MQKQIQKLTSVRISTKVRKTAGVTCYVREDRNAHYRTFKMTNKYKRLQYKLDLLPLNFIWSKNSMYCYCLFHKDDVISSINLFFWEEQNNQIQSSDKSFHYCRLEFFCKSFILNKC